MFFVLYVRFIMPLSVYRITLWLVLNVDKSAYVSRWFRQVYFHSTIKSSSWRGRKLTGYQVNELGNSPSIYISRYRSLMPFTLMDNSSAFATNSSHVNVQGVFAIVFYIQGTKFKSRSWCCFRWPLAACPATARAGGCKCTCFLCCCPRPCTQHNCFLSSF